MSEFKVPSIKDLRALYTLLEEQPDPYQTMLEQQILTHKMWGMAEQIEKMEKKAT